METVETFSASLSIAGYTSTTAFASDSASIAFRIEISYLRETGKYCLVLENVNLGSKVVKVITSLPTSLITITNNGGTFTPEGGLPTASIRGTLQIIS